MRDRVRFGAWAAWVVLALLAMDVVGGVAYVATVALSGFVVWLATGGDRAHRPTSDRTRDVAVIAATYVVVVAALATAFRVFGTDRTFGLFIFFAFALLTGVAGPVYYTVWVRGRPLADLGLRLGDPRRTLGSAALFASVQFAITLWAYDLPRPVDWVPLLAMALTVGVFESVFFRGFLQARLQHHFGDLVGVLVAAAAYGLYHVGYGMGWEEMGFLVGLGLVYAVAFALTDSVFVLWPLLTPLGSFFAQVDAGDVDLPWAAIAGFADVLGLMALAMVLGRRHHRRHGARTAAPSPVGSVGG